MRKMFRVQAKKYRGMKKNFPGCLMNPWCGIVVLSKLRYNERK